MAITPILKKILQGRPRACYVAKDDLGLFWEKSYYIALAGLELCSSVALAGLELTELLLGLKVHATTPVCVTEFLSHSATTVYSDCYKSQLGKVARVCDSSTEEPDTRDSKVLV